jgi:peptidoglycan/LPS O-acetylase OafA/YrhL
MLPMRPSPGAAISGDARDLPGYRADIDGLRALAVLAVVLYHAGLPWLPGGYLGVDVFFVISGFLITGMLRAQLPDRTSSLAWFYVGRVRRLLPALLAMLAASSLAGWLLLPPPDIVHLGGSLASTALFSFNLKAIAEHGYFSPDGQSDPLLHTWSLSVEEQFYLLFPLLLVAVRGWTPRKYLLLCAVLMGVSLLSALWLGRYSPNTAFYFGVPRAWELLLGSVLAIASGRRRCPGWAAQGTGAAGVAMIVLAALNEPFGPIGAVHAVVPCVGTALVIWSGTQSATLARAVLSWRPLVFVGLVSYSLYLWHWPLIVFYRVAFPFQPLPAGALLACTLLLAALSWRFVEQPFRQARIAPRQVLRLAAAAVCACLVTATILIATGGGDWRVSPRVRGYYEFDHYPAEAATRDGSCFLSPRHVSLDYFDRAKCLPAVSGKPSYLLVGDSHAAHLWAGLAQVFPEATVQQATASGCPPLLGAGSGQCQAFMNEILGRVVPATRPDAVILSARWGDQSLDSLRRTIAALRQHTRTVIVLGPIVEYRMPLPRVLALAEQREDPALVTRARLEGGAALDASMAIALRDTGATYLSTYRALCPEASGECTTTTAGGNVPVQFDYGHLTVDGAALVAQRLRSEHPSAWPR